MTIETSRRDFLAASGLVIGLALPMGRAAAAATSGAPFQPNAFVRIAADDSVTVIIKHVEFGQGPSTGLTTILADELDADWAQMRMAFSPANDPLYKNLAFGTMGTGGSTAMANSWMQMRTAGAAARAMLVEAAAKRWGVPAADIKVSKGVVSHGTHHRARFGELAGDAATLPVPTAPKLKTHDQFTLISTDLPKLDTRAKTDGSARFTMDIAVPDMVHSAILHPPAFGATVKTVDDSAARAVAGVVAVKAIPQGVVVYAKDSFAAIKGRGALKVDWDLTKAETRSSDDLFRAYAQAVQAPGKEALKIGDVDAALKGAAKTIDATYFFPFLAHAPMEPLDAVIERQGDRANLYMGSQFQVGETRAVAKALGIPFENMTLKQQFAGGSFGRRAQPGSDFAVEAGTIAANAPSAAVKHVWTRENDIRGGRYRPITVHRLRGGVDAKGDIIGWDQRVAVQPFVATPGDAIDDGMYEGCGPDDYSFANARIGVAKMANGVPTLWWRSVGHTHTAYASEAFLDDLFALSGRDPVAGRLALLKEARAKAVLNRVAEIAKWGGAVPSGRARGVAFHKSFGSYVAQIAEVSKGADGLPKVHKIWCAVDCGTPINPNVIRAQMESGIGYGLGHALYAELVLGEGGRVAQGNFDSYRSLRINEMPAVEVSIIKSTENPTGVGEPGLPPIAPAVANAWRKLTGRSVRRLPFAAEENA
ncbi:MAG: xanthine dehydrogenase family protein molybdopterin-binding subunit [Sphingomonas sp.]|nr:xanthine dehydrogenase family protein molybdopterin-binding subunit [Sphingomonas sp.]